MIRQIQRCRLVVTGSYHAGVFALASGIPVVGLAKSSYYRDKFLGLADMFAVGCETVTLDESDCPTSLRDAIHGFMRLPDNSPLYPFQRREADRCWSLRVTAGYGNSLLPHERRRGGRCLTTLIG